MKFGDHLKSERQQRHFTQQQVADDMNVSRQTISSWETEHSYPDIESLIRLSDYYQVSLDTLLKEDSGMTEYLKKQEILKSIKPILWVLMLIDLVFLGFFLLQLFDIIKVAPLVLGIFLVTGLLNGVALIALTNFSNGLSKDNRLFPKKIGIILGFLVISIVLAIFFAFENNAKLAGLFSGIAVGLITVLLIRKFGNRTQY